ncbi:MAG: dTDP-4-amino-4,6-dideoxygalactose transaminase, partial [Planctomycetota bacterium]
MPTFIPLNRVSSVGAELSYIREAIAQDHLAGDGRFTRKVQALLQDTLGVHKVLLTSSGTHALEMSALMLDVQPGDEVIVPSFTFVTSASAFALRGARPVFIDIRPDTLNLDETQLERLITPRTKAIVPVHYSGVGCEMDAIQAVAQHYRIPVVEDNAHGLFAQYRGRPLGSFGSMAILSFHETKNFTCGEGGALLVNDPQYVELAEIIREKGTDRSRFLRGQVDKYTWVALGSSYLPSELQAAFLCAQLEAREWIQQRRRSAWECYRRNLEGWAAENQVKLPVIPEHCEQLPILQAISRP